MEYTPDRLIDEITQARDYYKARLNDLTCRSIAAHTGNRISYQLVHEALTKQRISQRTLQLMTEWWQEYRKTLDVCK